MQLISDIKIAFDGNFSLKGMTFIKCGHHRRNNDNGEELIFFVFVAFSESVLHRYETVWQSLKLTLLQHDVDVLDSMYQHNKLSNDHDRYRAESIVSVDRY